MSNTIKKFFSLDIETTGLDPRDARIWSVGLSGEKKDAEYFISKYNLDPKLSRSGVPSASYLYTNEFQNKQEKVLSEWFDAQRSRNLIRVEESLKRIFSQIDKNSAIIIQNVNFENKMLAEIFDRSDKLRKSVQSKMMQYSDTQSGKLLYTPLQVTAMRQEARDLKYAGKLDESMQKSVDIISEYRRLGNIKNSGAYTIELMDITRGTYAKAAQKGFLPKSMGAYGSYGLSVDVLSQAFGLGEEMHSSLDDARRQTQIYNKLNTLFDELETGNISRENLEFLKKIKEAKPLMAAKTFISSLHRGIEEFKGPGYRLVENSGQEKRPVSVKDRVLGKDRVRDIFYLRNAPAAASIDEVIESVLSRHGDQSTGGLLDKDRIINNVKNLGSPDKQLKYLSRVNDLYQGKLNEYFQTGKLNIGARTSVEAEGVKEDIKEKVKRMPGSLKIAGGVGVSLVAAYTLLGGGDEEEERKAKLKSQYRDMQQNNEFVFNMYNTDMYNGTGFYLWENAIGHHKY